MQLTLGHWFPSPPPPLPQLVILSLCPPQLIIQSLITRLIVLNHRVMNYFGQNKIKICDRKELN